MTRPIPLGMVASDVVPDLAIEVISPSNTANEIAGKLAEYFEAGVRQTWVVYVEQRLVYIYRSVMSVRIVGVDDDLDGGEILPGFTLRLADLFEVGEQAP